MPSSPFPEGKGDEKMACNMCWHPDAGKHNDGCPQLNGDLEEFKKGQAEGFNGEVLLWHELRNYSLSFRYGYRAGRNEIEGLIEDAVVQQFYE